jgi:hypothetical protein
VGVGDGVVVDAGVGGFVVDAVAVVSGTGVTFGFAISALFVALLLVLLVAMGRCSGLTGAESEVFDSL